MQELQITNEILQYLSDASYHYAVLIDGEWGCGKTYYVKQTLMERIRLEEQRKEVPGKVRYLSLYGCKTVEEIQDNMILGFAEDAKKKLRRFGKNKVLKKAETVLSSGRKLLTAAAQHFIPEASGKAYDILSDWISLKEYIFIFDDLERCDCPLNEVFGFLNGLVEHEEMKIILVANEREIDTGRHRQQPELQYLVAMNNEIVWPEAETSRYWKTNTKPSLNQEELERRRSLLFPEEELDDSYGRIREKLIGVTLHYQPDISSVISGILKNSTLDAQLQEVLKQKKDFFFRQMDQYHHHNLRTFQFYLSKLSMLYRMLQECDLEEDDFSMVLSGLAENCFLLCVEFKAHVKPPLDQWQRILFDGKTRMASVKLYVEQGDFQKDLFEQEIRECLEKLKCRLTSDDPLHQLQSEYWLHSQEWVTEQMENILQRLQESLYGLPLYQDIMLLFLRMEMIGFSPDYVNRMKTLMLANIEGMTGELHLHADTDLIEDAALRQKVSSLAKEMNAALTRRSFQVRQETLTDILQGENWIEGLCAYTNTPLYFNQADGSVFNKAEESLWLDAIRKADPKDLVQFRQWLLDVYPKQVIRECGKRDVPMLRRIASALEPEQETDLIKRFDLRLLKKDMEELIDAYQ